MQLVSISVNGEMKMKTAITAVILFAAAIGAHASDDKDKKKAAAPTPQAMTIPRDAVPNSDRTSYAWTDQQGKKWNYVNTPFGVTRFPASDAPAGALDFSTWKSIDKGDTVRFERPTPFGPFIREKKKSDLTDDERRFLDEQNAKTEQKND
jgi:hypothetical protein